MSCPRHPDATTCPYRLAEQYAPLIRGAKSDPEAAEIAQEAMRQIAKLAGCKPPRLTT